MVTLKREKVETKLRDMRGNIAATARAFRCSRQTLYTFIATNDLQGALDEARETMLDDAESSLYASILAREAWAVCFALKTIGRNRGYIERTQTEIGGIKNGNAIEIRATDYRDAIATLAPRPVGDSAASGEDEGYLHG